MRDIETLSRLLGHANPKVPQNIYVKKFDQSLREAAVSLSIRPLAEAKASQNNAIPASEAADRGSMSEGKLWRE